MPTVRQRITLIGTGCIGASIGLALRQSADAAHLEIVGHDCDLSVARQAHKLGALDRAEFNLDLALTDARFVILAVPLASLREVLSDLGRLLEPDAGVVVTDTAPLKAPAIAWADELLPPGNFFVGGDPFLAPGAAGWERLAGPDAARADLFARAVYAITPRPTDHRSAINAVLNLAHVLGAEPLLMDPVEHDTARAMADGVPGIVATALFQATATMPGWAETRKAAGRIFVTATAGADGDAASRRMAALLAREATLRGLDALQSYLAELRRAIAEGDAESLETTFANVAQAREYWLAETRARSWDITPGGLPTDTLFQRTMQTLLGEALVGKRPPQKGQRI